jgi:hypothetical protein
MNPELQILDVEDEEPQIAAAKTINSIAKALRPPLPTPFG